MTSSTLEITPRTPTHPRSLVSNVDRHQPWHLHAYTAEGQAFQRAIRPGYHRWLAHVRPAAGCTHPIRLFGTVNTIEATTGRRLSRISTSTLPDGVIYKACGNRRAMVCPSCASTYQADAYQLIRAGLAGGKGVPETVARHPAVFVTLTAPSFGPVHTHRTNSKGLRLACRPRRLPERCPHGIDLRCHRFHTDTDPVLGQPLCLDCYDHHQVVWNTWAPELWRRTRITLERHLRKTARTLGIPAGSIRLRYAKVAEMQRRGVVHFHAIIRLDGHHPDDPEQVLPPPAGLDVDHLTQAVTAAARTTCFTTAPHPANPTGWRIAWGQQVDIRPIRIDGGKMTDGMAAGYLAKYATKSTEATGHISRRLTAEIIDLYADPNGTHAERLVDACWTLGAHPDWQGLRRWAHMLGFGGHFLTKARRYSITFQILRHQRVVWRRTENGHPAAGHDPDTILIISALAYVGAGWRTPGDGLLANTAATLARDRQHIARQEVTTAS